MLLLRRSARDEMRKPFTGSWDGSEIGRAVMKSFTKPRLIIPQFTGTDDLYYTLRVKIAVTTGCKEMEESVCSLVELSEQSLCGLCKALHKLSLCSTRFGFYGS